VLFLGEFIHLYLYIIPINTYKNNNGDLYMSVTFSYYWSGGGLTGGRGLNVIGVAFDSNNNLYATSASAQFGYNGVYILPQGGNWNTNGVNGVTTIASYGNNTNPYCLTFDLSKNLYVGFVGVNALYKLSPPYSSSVTYSSYSAATFTIDNSGNLYVASTDNNIYRIKPDLTSSLFLSGKGGGIVFCQNGYLYATVYGGNSVYQIALDGTYSTFVTLPNGDTTYDAIVVDKSNNIYVSGISNGVYRITQQKTVTLISQFTGIQTLAFDSNGYLYGAVGWNGAVVSNTVVAVAPPSYPCFNKGSKILTDKGYKPIQDLRKGDLVKTFKSGYKPISLVGKKEIHHKANSERIKDQLYKLSKHRYPALWEDLILTGCHSILVDAFVSEKQKERTIQINGDAYLTEDKYRLPTCADEKATVYETPGKYTVYHVALENDSYYGNYGIYANGLLVESCSKRYLKELSNMNFVV
jgi:hypothetical protein